MGSLVLTPVSASVTDNLNVVLKNALSILEKKVENQNSSIIALEGKVSNQNSTITIIQSNLDALINRVAALEASGGGGTDNIKRTFVVYCNGFRIDGFPSDAVLGKCVCSDNRSASLGYQGSYVRISGCGVTGSHEHTIIEYN